MQKKIGKNLKEIALSHMKKLQLKIEKIISKRLK
jgi:hypothetical protein